MDYAGAILERDDGKILFQLRDNNPNIFNPNKWSLFGGGIEKGESPKEALIRELHEELGLIIKKSEIKNPLTINLIAKRNYIFRVKFNEGKEKISLQEGQKFEFLSVKELLKKNNVVKEMKLFFVFYEPIIKKLFFNKSS